jgi:thiamine biosynthesis lipoprotein
MILVVNSIGSQSGSISKTGRLALFLVVAFLFACSRESGEKKFTGSTMGTTYHITVINPSSHIDLLDLQQDVEKTLKNLTFVFSTYEADSELSRLNRAPVGIWVPVSEDLFAVLELAQQVAKKTNGAYDVTVSPLVDLWGFGAVDRLSEMPPGADALQKALTKVCFRCIKLDKSRHAVLKTQTLEIDLSSIAKGYAVDQVSELLYRRKLDKHLVEIGGELRARGVNATHTKWQLGIEKPSMQPEFSQKLSQGIQQVIELENRAVATSGDYRNYLMVNGKRYSHIINPETGYPVEHAPASVTVVTQQCAEADAWATALTVLGREKGLALAQSENLAVYFIERKPDESVNISMNDAFKSYLKRH